MTTIRQTIREREIVTELVLDDDPPPRNVTPITVQIARAIRKPAKAMLRKAILLPAPMKVSA